ncbi:hypothetical protein EMCRGX_G014516 [Ephydatia muelleri]|eukprot:Em0005g1447a
MTEISEEELQATYAWIDEIPLSRQKKSIARDFSDGVLVAEVVHHFLPKLVELHNYSPASSSPQKMENWRTLNRKVFSKLGLSVPEDLLQGVVASKPGVIEYILNVLKGRMELYLENHSRLESVTTEDLYSNMHLHDGMYDPAQLVSDFPSGRTHNILDESLYRHTGAAAQPSANTYPFHYNPYPGGIKQSNSISVESAPNIHSVASRLPVPNHLKHRANPSPAHHLPPPPPPPSHTFATLPSLAVPQQGHKGPPNSKVGKLPNLVKSNYSRNAPEVPAVYEQAGVKKGKAEMDTSANAAIKKAETEQKLMEYQETIQLLHMKITRLEHLVKIKDIKITELTKQAEAKQQHSHPKR